MEWVYSAFVKLPDNVLSDTVNGCSFVVTGVLSRTVYDS